MQNISSNSIGKKGEILTKNKKKQKITKITKKHFCYFCYLTHLFMFALHRKKIRCECNKGFNGPGIMNKIFFNISILYYKQMQYQNTLIYWLLLIIIFSYVNKKYSMYDIKCKIILFLILYILLFLAIEIMEQITNISIWNQTERTTNCYNWFEQYFSEDYSDNLKMDYVESLFDGDYSLTIREATIKKFNYVYDNLKLKPGMSLLDMGCGVGLWMLFCKQRGINVMGITLSEEQAKKIREKKMNVIVGDYRIMRKELLNKFDTITLFGSTEHNCLNGSLLYNKTVKKCNNTRIKIFKLCHSYLKNNGNMFIATLISNEKYVFKLSDYPLIYFMERHYGGRYSTFNDYSNSLIKAGFNINYIKDTTKDYHWSSIADPDHFGAFKIKWNEHFCNKLLYIGKGLIMDPFLLHHWIYYSSGVWMWQFGGYQNTPLTDEQVYNVPCHNKNFFISK